MAPVADAVYQNAHRAGFRDAWLGTIAFSGQIFFDFAGYSMCGIGAALCLGFALKDNFHFPYAAIGFSDFWRRWHISLSTWLRDYLYVPLGGNRDGEGRTYANLLLTMLLGGLWHDAPRGDLSSGAGSTAAISPASGRSENAGQTAPWLERRDVRFGLAMLTWLLVCITWVFFRAPDFSSAIDLIRTMFHRHPVHPIVTPQNGACVLLVTAALLLGQWILRDSTLEQATARLPRWALACCLGFMLLSLCVASGEDRAFIYFQF